MDEMPTPASLPRALGRWLALSVGVGAAVGMIFSARRGGTSFGDFAANWAITTLYTASIGLPMMLLFRRWSLPPGRSALARWSIYAGIVLAATAIGTLATSLVLAALGVASLDQLWL